MTISCMIGIFRRNTLDYIGFTHPYTAANNAKNDYGIGPIEEDIIVHHMFPLTMLSTTV